MSYNVYTAEHLGQLNHVTIFIETEPSINGSIAKGTRYHVTGTILMGMDSDPETLPTYVPGTKRKIGVIAKGDLERFETECCKAVPPPTSQVFLNGKPKDPSKPLYRCGEWIEDVKKLALEKGIIKP